MSAVRKVVFMLGLCDPGLCGGVLYRSQKKRDAPETSKRQRRPTKNRTLTVTTYDRVAEAVRTKMSVESDPGGAA